MPNAWGLPTEEEKMAMMIRSGMNNPFAAPVTMQSQVDAALSKKPLNIPGSPQAPQMPPERAMSAFENPDLAIDVTGREREIERARKLAQGLRGTQMGMEGKTVGPLGVYHGPNIGEIIGGAAQRIGGGLMDRSTNKREAEVEALRKAKAQAEADAAAEARRYDIGRDIKSDEQYDARLAAEAAQREADAAWRQRAEERAMREEERQKAKDKLKEGERTPETMIIPGEEEPFRALVDSAGRVTFASGERAGEEVPSNAVDYNTWVDNQRQQQALEDRIAKGDLDGAAEQLDTDLIKYGKDLQKSNLPATLKAVEELDTLIAGIEGIEIDPETGRYLNAGEVEVPGTGGLQNTTILGGIITQGAEANQIRAARQKVKSEILKIQSGAAVTLPEQLRNDISTAMEWSSTDEDFLTTWPAIRSQLYAVKDNYDAAYSPDVVDIYNRRQAGERLTSRQYLEGAKSEDEELAALKALLAEDEDETP